MSKGSAKAPLIAQRRTVVPLQHSLGTWEPILRAYVQLVAARGLNLIVGRGLRLTAECHGRPPEEK
jgi:hypothetical protein